ncbi:OLC1v1033474C3 [Oldenlandia corymbosa var. corymbosa]|uniref:histone acetyltransferase n=1 Tax=Oldenlandia corymbosa var. corymbosa TaxID=529605 RepID=A0AAV1CP44_OLDCO|nr:OLC1v1033474C3 [Oldenlandia corymbosa var. corymbosa]
MNLQAHMSGQLSGQVPNQSASSLTGMSQQNGNLSVQMQNPVAHRNMQNVDSEFVKAREMIAERIFEYLVQRLQHAHDMPHKKILDLVKRLEEGLFKSAGSKEEYLNLSTLESRLHFFTQRLPGNPSNQFSRVNTSSSIGTMIPTPGMPQSGNSNMMGMSSMDNGGNIANLSSKNLLPTAHGPSLSAGHGGSYSSSDGSAVNGYQHSTSNFGINSGGNSLGSSMGAQRMASQMIPTPGFSSTGSDAMNNINNQGSNSYMNMDSSNNVGAFSNVESTVVPQPMPQKQHVGGQNSRILHNLGSHMGGGIRPGMQQKSYGLSNGVLNGGLGMMSGNQHAMNGSGTSDGFTGSSMYGNSHKSLQQPYDSNQRALFHGDGYGINTSDSSGSGNLFVTSTSSMPVMSNQNLNAVTLQSMPKTSSPVISNQSHTHISQQVANMKAHSVDSMEKNFQPQHSMPENIARSHQLQHFQQQPHQFQQAQMVPHQRQQKLQTHQQHLSAKNDAFGHSQLSADLGVSVKTEPGNEGHLHSQMREQFQYSEMPNQFGQNSLEDQSRSGELLPFPSGPQDQFPSLAQNSEQMRQLMHQNQFGADSQSDFICLPGGVQSDSVAQGQWYTESHDQSQNIGAFPHERSVQEEFRQRIAVQDEAQQNNLPSDGTINAQSVAPIRVDKISNVGGAACRSVDLTREKQFWNQARWLLFLRHARRCPDPVGKCPDPNCMNAQELLRHMEKCESVQCSHPRCSVTKGLISHYKRCKSASCPVCIPVKKFLQAQFKALSRPHFGSGFPRVVNGSLRQSDTGDHPGRQISKTIVETPQDLQPSIKRMKIEQSSVSLGHEIESAVVPVSTMETQVLHNTQQTTTVVETTLAMKSEMIEVKAEPANVGPGSPKSNLMKKDNMDDSYMKRPDTADPPIISSTSGLAKQGSVKSEKETNQAKEEVNSSLPADHAGASKSGKPKIKGVSLTELFTPEQVREHIKGLRQWVGQSKAKAEKNQAMEQSMSENSCQLCAVEKLTFEPPPIYCTPCNSRIKRNAMYYTIGTGDTRHYFCIPCYNNEPRGDTIIVDGTAIPKARLEKKKNDEETEEWWVQCDKCEAWQHQICALFNGRRNDGGQAEYTCPNCYIQEVERGERKPLPQSAVLGAKDLPRTILSDQIEMRLARRLKHERQERANAQGKSIDEVPGADGLVVRVVSSVDKKLDVKSRFLEIFQEDNYPLEFPYKSKVLLLFQKIEGVEVCLFGMYVQEFGAECQQPNHRRVYLSYLDSVKYFRPEVKTVTGEALRTFVYHEILVCYCFVCLQSAFACFRFSVTILTTLVFPIFTQIGYLEYCKKRGFTSCYIWACPPLKGEDYILYCHPEIQKTPKSDKLREWYLAMLRKAAKENIVVDLTNLYDHFFVSTGECKAKVTAARLPYFDGDYWPGAAEDMLLVLQQEEDGRKQHKKGTIKKTITKRALKASGQTDLSGNASKDLLLMHKLGETISPMKEDFIMVHLQHCCTHCCILMVSGKRWVCKQCKNFQICDRCYEAEQNLEDRERHPIHQKDKHLLYPVEINDVPADTKDRDEILESEFFDTRQAFLSLCQGNHYQYDTLRRAKHSSMMVLYHLHNPTAPAFVTTCNLCYLDIEAGQGWRCEICPEYDICNACYQKGGIEHPHKLTNHPSTAERDAQNKEARQMRVLQLRKMLDLLVHASQCRSPQCQYPNCRKVKGLFRHGIQCKTRASGGCVLCKRMWYLLQLHARACRESECHVPRCRDLKEHLKRLQQQSDSRRRAAVMEMMRQRAAEVAGNSG